MYFYTLNTKFIICTANIKNKDCGYENLDHCKIEYVLYKLSSTYEPQHGNVQKQKEET